MFIFFHGSIQKLLAAFGEQLTNCLVICLDDPASFKETLRNISLKYEPKYDQHFNSSISFRSLRSAVDPANTKQI